MSIERTFLGLDSSAWTAIATAALVLVTLVYVILTGRMARHAAASARASERSARSAERAAEATSRAAAIAEAALGIDFDIAYQQFHPEEQDPVEDWVSVTCKGATVYLRGLSIEVAVVYKMGGEKPTFVTGMLDPAGNSELPVRIHNGESVPFQWHGPSVDLKRTTVGSASVRYSIDDEGPERSMRRSMTFGAV